MSTSWVLAFSAGVALTVCATRAATDPTTAPAPMPATSPATGLSTRPTSTTAPSTRAVDLSTPKGALRALAGGLTGGDGDQLRQVVLPATAQEAKMVEAMADMAAALVALHRAAAAAFGEPAAVRFTGNSEAELAQSLARIESAEVSILPDGERATVRYAGAEEPGFDLARVAGRWRVPASQFCKGADEPTLERAVAETNVQVRVVRDLVAEIVAGKHRTADAASDAWHSKMMQALGSKTPTTTQAATRP